MSGLRWTRRTTLNLSNWLTAHGQPISPNTVGRLLRSMNFALRTNRKRIESGGRKKLKPKDRDRQFKRIKQMRQRFAREGLPVVSIDAKKRELIGPFRNPGQTWSKENRDVYDHDYRSDAKGIGIPHVLFDTVRNHASVCIGTSYETPAFSVDHLIRWWRTQGKKSYPNAKELLILADCGGSNSARSRVFKARLHQLFCVPFQVKVTLCHYPPGTSKWNPVEHRVLCHIQNNWAGRPLDTYEVMLKYLRTTTTSKGLKVTAYLNRKGYEKGEIASDKRMKALPILRYKAIPAWNYTILPCPLRHSKV